MTTLILQTAAILLSAYFLGAWIACLVRRTFFADADEFGAGVGAAAQPRMVIPAADTDVRVAPPARRPDPKPIALETIERGAPHAASDAASRFEEVLTTAPKPAVAVAPAVVRPAPPPAAPAVIAKPATPVAPPPAPAVPVSQPVTPAAAPVATTSASVNAGAIAQAAAAAAAIVPAVVAAVSKPAAPVAPPVHQNFPAASSGAGPSAVSAPIAPPQPIVAPASATDDLTRIRSIDTAAQQRLLKLGVTRYRDIAGWLPSDVEKVSRELGFTGRIEQENWIEQAQILARGGETAYARRKAMGEIATATPSANQGVARPAASLAPAPVPVAPASANPSAIQPATLPQVENRAAFAQQPKPAAASATAPSATPSAVPAPVLPAAPAAVAAVAAPIVAAAVAAVKSAVVAPSVATPAPAPAPVPVQPLAAKPMPPAPSPIGAGALATATAAAAAAGAASGMGRDNLQRIGGINAEVERLLNVQGVSRYGQIAGWSPVDVGRFDQLLGHEGRVGRENWVEQARTLASGGDTAFSRQFDQRVLAARPAVAADAPRPSRLVDAIRDTAVKPTGEFGNAAATAAAAAAGAVVSAATAAASAPRASDLSGMRSVRSEAYAPQIGAKSTGTDDLKRIRGVGVLIEKKLNSMGVSSYAQVANWSAADIDRVSQVLDFKGRIERENWVEQARILSAGGQTEFSRRVDRGEVETSRS